MKRTLAGLAVAVVATACDAGGDAAPTTSAVEVAPVTTAAVVAPAAPATTAAPVPVVTTPPPPQLDIGLVLAGSEWELDAVIAGEAAEAVPRGIPDSTLSFDDGVAFVDTSCTSGQAPYSTSGDQLTIEGLDLPGGCSDPLAGDVERSVLHVLGGSATVRFDNGILNLLRDGEQLVYLPD